MFKFTSACLIGLLSISANAGDFERGFREGKNSCRPVKEAWLCRVVDPDNQIPFNDMFLANTGPTRAETLMDMNSEVLALAKQLGLSVDCSLL